MTKTFLIFALMLIFWSPLFAQKEGDVIINEIGNGGTKKPMYSGGDYIELLVVKPEGVKLAGWYLTDLSSPSGTPKETEGYIKFSDKEGSVFNQVLTKGTYILVCLGDSQLPYGADVQKESISGRIIVFADQTNKHMEKVEGTIVLTGKDNIALTSAWEKSSAIDALSWMGSSSWTGCETTQLALETLDNGKVAYFTPTDANFKNNSCLSSWISSTETIVATAGSVNKNVDDSLLKK